MEKTVKEFEINYGQYTSNESKEDAINWLRTTLQQKHEAEVEKTVEAEMKRIIREVNSFSARYPETGVRLYQWEDGTLGMDTISFKEAVSSKKHFSKKDRQAHLYAIVEALEGIRKDYEVQADGQYHFGENQKVTGHNQGIDQAIATVQSIYQDNK